MATMTNVYDSLVAVNDYMQRTPTKTEAAQTLRNLWNGWYPNLNFIQMRMDSTYQEAVNRRNAFNVANTTNLAELEKVREVVQTGHSTVDIPGKDEAGNYPDAKGITVASAQKGTVVAGARPTIRKGAKGDPVKAWQAILGAKPDGVFGPDTERLTIEFQKKHGLKADGVVGGATWGAAMTAGNVGNMSFQQAAVTPVAPVSIPASQVPTGTVAQVAATQTPVAPNPPPPVQLPPVIVADSEKQPKTKPKPGQSMPVAESPPVAEAGIIPLPLGFIRRHWKGLTLGTLGLAGLGGIAKAVLRK